MNKKVLEYNKYLSDKKIAIIGAGVSNIPLISYMANLSKDVVLFDKNELSVEVMNLVNKYNIGTFVGEDYLKKLVGFDVIFRSPSCLPNNEYLKAERERGAVITTEVEEVIKLAPCKVIGITGSDGKTTTTTLISIILERLGYNVFTGGNIGKPIFVNMDKVKEDDIIVLELSSFQLMDMSVSPDISVITNISPNHLDIHSSYQEYIDAKKCIFKHQNKDSILVLNYDDELVRSFAKESNSLIRYFSSKEKLKDSYVILDDKIMYNDDEIINVNDLKIKGRHNYINICTALSAIKDYITDMDKVIDIIKEFPGVNHRIEFVREINGVKWYNDSASSTPTRTIAGIYAFNEPIILIAGGYDKNIPYDVLSKPILEKVRVLILFGNTKNKIYDAVMEEKRKVSDSNLQIYVMDTLDEVIDVAYQVAKSGEVVLFSPASASFDMFKNAYQRGDIFKEKVMNIKNTDSD